MARAFTHDPEALYRASLERMEAAWTLFDQDDWTTAFYLGGLAVECVLQALALRSGADHDARHDLRKWLSKCPDSVKNSLQSLGVSQFWNRVVTQWTNTSRYMDHDKLLAHMRKTLEFRHFKGDHEARFKQTVKLFLVSAETIHTQGVNQWRRSNKSSKH